MYSLVSNNATPLFLWKKKNTKVKKNIKKISAYFYNHGQNILTIFYDY